MPVLTDQKDPEPPDKSDEPPEYAMKYLFTGQREWHEDWRRAALVLVISGGLGTMFALFYITFNTELKMSLALWLLQLGLILCGIRAIYEVWSQKRAFSWFTVPPLFLVIAALLWELAVPDTFNGLLNIYFSIPAALALCLGGVLLVSLKRR